MNEQLLARLKKKKKALGKCAHQYDEKQGNDSIHERFWQTVFFMYCTRQQKKKEVKNSFYLHLIDLLHLFDTL